ncbi:MAG: bifunctional precorrin-2 dehydrogenase/sirohydrochlorin ferrochelatase [Magnetococcales bacterium]|nr:bifunctional precorrin-2 dehydrogenase/sirohydrochlorin ferrochelatase [Magnetococcales bacterium]
MDGNLLPLFLRLQDRACLLVGGEGEAHPKGAALLRAGARLTIVAPELEGYLLREAQAGRASWRAEPFEPAHLDGMWLAVSALGDVVVNARLYAAAEERRVLLNVVDQPRYCTFVWPALVERPPVTVAIGTGGHAPALAGYLRRRIDAWLPAQVGALAESLAAWRRLVPGGLASRARFWRDLLDRGLAERFLDGDEKGAAAMVQDALANRQER